MQICMHWIRLLVTWLFCVLLLASACMQKKKHDTGQYTIVEKYMDIDYMVQEVKMVRCINALSDEEHLRHNFLKTFYQNLAYLDQRSKIDENDMQEFTNLNFLDCFAPVALHKANSIICKHHREQYTGYDLLKKYADKEFLECVLQKNLDAKKPFVVTLSTILEVVEEGALLV